MVQGEEGKKKRKGKVMEEDDCFKKGAIVEVSFEDEGFRGSWYAATVVRTVSKKSNKIFLELHTLMADDKGTKPLREFVDIILVRPIPPREAKRTFKINEEVDAFHNDGWWEGILTDIIHPKKGNGGDGRPKYSVFFRSSREQLEFYESDLRLHREWVYGKWVPPLEEDAYQLPGPSNATKP